MTAGGALECINRLKAAFPSFKPDADQTESTIKLWCEIFEKTDAEKVKDAITTYVKSGSEFPPSVGQLRKIVNSKAKKDEADGSGGHWEIKTYRIPAKDVRLRTSEGLVPVYKPDDMSLIEYGKRVWVENT